MFCSALGHNWLWSDKSISIDVINSVGELCLVRNRISNSRLYASVQGQRGFSQKTSP